MNATERKRAIGALNDTLRTTFLGGRIMLTSGVNALPDNVKSHVLDRVRTYDDFNKDNDPYGEHDFGSFALSGHEFFWKMDYYDKTMEHGSEDPTDPKQTSRVLTIMLQEEY